MGTSSSPAAVEDQQQQQPPSRDHDRAAANVEEGLVRQVAIDNHFYELQRAAVEVEWETARTILDRLSILDVNPEIHSQVLFIHATIASISISGGKQTINFFTKLVTYLPDESLLETLDSEDRTLLHYAGITGNKAATLVLVERLPKLLYVAKSGRQLPVHVAACYSQRETLEYLMSVTILDVAKSPAADADGQLLLFYYVAYAAEFFDIALDLIDKYPQLATEKSSPNETALVYMAEVASKYSAGSRPRRFNNCRECLLRTFPQIKSNNDEYRKQRQILEVVKCLCKALESFEGAWGIYKNAVLTAARCGGHEFIEVIAERCPRTITVFDSNCHSIFCFAITHRHECVFSLIYRVSGFRRQISDGVDLEGNNMLHLAAKLAPSYRLDQISGAALQMQYEIQWYQEVEKLVSTVGKVTKNNDKMTPWMLFIEEHKKLKDNGEKWMKYMAKSCSIVAALIITIMFTAAITVPGGNESNSGFPIFRGEQSFVLFSIADAISLFTSTTSLLIFLSILTSSFPEESFLYYHPTQLIFGLGTLFLSIASMMVAFTSTTFLVLGKKEVWILIPTIVFASLGIVSFAFLQFPLLCSLISSTYGSGMFNKKSGKRLW